MGNCSNGQWLFSHCCALLCQPVPKHKRDPFGSPQSSTLTSLCSDTMRWQGFYCSKMYSLGSCARTVKHHSSSEREEKKRELGGSGVVHFCCIVPRSHFKCTVSSTFLVIVTQLWAPAKVSDVILPFCEVFKVTVVLLGYQLFDTVWELLMVVVVLYLGAVIFWISVPTLDCSGMKKQLLLI